jgi:hypothetical protein
MELQLAAAALTRGWICSWVTATAFPSFNQDWWCTQRDRREHPRLRVRPCSNRIGADGQKAPKISWVVNHKVSIGMHALIFFGLLHASHQFHLNWWLVTLSPSCVQFLVDALGVLPWTHRIISMMSTQYNIRRLEGTTLDSIHVVLPPLQHDLSRRAFFASDIIIAEVRLAVAMQAAKAHTTEWEVSAARNHYLTRGISAGRKAQQRDPFIINGRAIAKIPYPSYKGTNMTWNESSVNETPWIGLVIKHPPCALFSKRCRQYKCHWGNVFEFVQAQHLETTIGTKSSEVDYQRQLRVGGGRCLASGNN